MSGVIGRFAMKRLIITTHAMRFEEYHNNTHAIETRTRWFKKQYPLAHVEVIDVPSFEKSIETVESPSPIDRGDVYAQIADVSDEVGSE